MVDLEDFLNFSLNLNGLDHVESCSEVVSAERLLVDGDVKLLVADKNVDLEVPSADNWKWR